MSDITDRLRDYGARYSQIDPEYLMCLEAANEIERLEAAIAARLPDRDALEAPILAVAAEKGLATGHGDTPEDMIRELVQGAFDCGFRAAGGSIHDVRHLMRSVEQELKG